MMIKKKLINHLTLNGSKIKGEKIFKESIKKIQKESTKSLKKVVQLSIINSTPIFKLHRISNKKRKKKKIKEIPSFIKNLNYRVSLSIKLILTSLKIKTKKISTKIKNEILQDLKSDKLSIQKKNELQKKASLNKRYFRYYRW